MTLVLRFPQPTATPLVRQMLFQFKAAFRTKRNNWAFNVRQEDHDPYFQAAVYHASLRFQETLGPDPLFADPYVRCLLPLDIQTDVTQDQGVHKHCVVTKFVDDKLLGTIQKIDGLRQVVLLTDGMDTRPYRLNWPGSTILFDVSLDRIFRRSIQKLQDVGAKIPRNCLFLHVPSEAADIQQVLSSKGFNGARPSVWVLQGLAIMSLANFEDILGVVSNLAMKGCIFFGELPGWLLGTDNGVKSATMEWMDKVFTSHGLRVEVIDYKEIARNLGQESAANEHENILFVAQQLQFSDEQMEIWRRELHRIEEAGDEEGFEEL